MVIIIIIIPSGVSLVSLSRVQQTTDRDICIRPQMLM
jgi:hypothetical protein